MVQWLSLHVPNTRGMGWIPGQGTSSHRPQLRICKPQLKPSEAQKKRKKETPESGVSSSLAAQLVKNPPAMGETGV